jgi:protein-S-isoprenylcysteine O-methyltransferase Ste14
METVAETVEGQLESASAYTLKSHQFKTSVVRNIVCNFGVASIFFVALWAHARNYHSLADVYRSMHSCGGLDDLVWIAGAALMGVLSLIRVPPVASMVNWRSVLATTVMMVAPTFIRARTDAKGLIALASLVIETFGVIISEGSRLYLGRRFGLLPANRGIVSGGPFAIVRHPIYLGWLVLTFGLVLPYPTLPNLFMLALILPVMILRINLEEQLLGQDGEYRAYCAKIKYRLIPFVY